MKFVFLVILSLCRYVGHSTVFLAIIICFTSRIYSQQIAQFSQYVDNGLFYNPAYAGSKQMLNFTAMHRQQWIGIEGIPKTTTLQIHSPTNYEALGVGLSILDESEGLIHKNIINTDISYSIFFNNNSQLSFGTKFGAYWMSFDRDKLFPVNKNTVEVQEWNFKRRFNVGVGLLYHSPHFFIGVSSPQLLENIYDMSGKNMDWRHYFTMLGAVVNIFQKWKVRPSLQVKLTNSSPISIDASTTFIYNDAFWMGFLYRYNNSVGAFLQFNLTKHLKIGMATEFSINELRNSAIETVEVLLSYNLKIVKKGVYSPRYF